MSMTKEQLIEDFKKESEYRAGKSQRLRPGALDQHYIDACLEYPFESQQKNLQRAMDEAGVEGTATRQRAYEIHERLRDKIDKQLVKWAKDAKAKGLRKLVELCEHAQSESVQLSAAITITKDLFPDIAITKDEAYEDLDQMLERNAEELEALTGKAH